MEYMLDDSVMVFDEKTEEELLKMWREETMTLCNIKDQSISNEELKFKYGCYIIANKMYEGDLEDLPSSMKRCIDYVKEHPEEFRKS